MKWQEVVLTTTHDASEAGANIFFEIGADGVVVEDPYVVNRYLEEGRWDCHDIAPELLLGDVVIIKGYVPVDDTLADKLDAFREKVSELGRYFRDYSGEISTSEVDDEDWASSWKKYFKTNRIGAKLIIKPSWEDYKASPGEIVVEMDPGSSFGTGTHATTVMCLELLEKYLHGGEVVFDVGCGSGVLGVTAAKLGACCVLARDIDPSAVQAARKNASANSVSSCMQVEAGSFLNDVRGRAHLIVANIVADAIIEFCPQAYGRLLPGGMFIASGIIGRRADEVEKELLRTGFIKEKTLLRDDWVTFLSRRK